MCFECVTGNDFQVKGGMQLPLSLFYVVVDCCTAVGIDQVNVVDYCTTVGIDHVNVVDYCTTVGIDHVNVTKLSSLIFNMMPLV